MTEQKMTLNTTWDGLIQGKGRMQSNTVDLPIAIPSAYGGNGEGSHPKELMTASATSCYVMALAGMASAHKLPLVRVEIESSLSNVSKDVMEIVHEVRIILAANATQEEIRTTEGLIAAADKACMVGNLLKTAGVQFSVSGTVLASADE